MRRHWWLAVVAASALLVSACGGGGGGGAASGGNPLVIGYIGDLTGPNTAVEVPYLKGIQAAVGAVNSAGGIGGRQIQLKVEDSRFDVSTGTAAYRKLTADKDMLALMGINGSSIIAALVKDIDKAGIPVIGPSATTTESLASPNFYNLQASLEDQGAALASYIAKQVPGAKVGTAVINVESGKNWQAVMAKDVPAAGATIVSDQKMDPGSVEASSQVSALKSAGANVISLHSNIALAVTLGKAMQSQGFDVPIYSSYGAMGDKAWQGIGAYSYDKLFAVNGFAPSYTDVPGRAELEKDVKAAGVADADWRNNNFTMGWVAGKILAEALTRAGANPTRESFVKALQSPEGFDTGGYSSKIDWSKPGPHKGVSEIRVFGWDAATNGIVPKSDFVAAAATS